MKDNYLYQVELPFSKHTISFKEFSTSDQLFITKALLSLPNTTQKNNILVKRLYELLEGCIENPHLLGLLTVPEVFLLMLRMRSVSMGSTTTLQITQADKPFTVEINFEEILKNIFYGLNDIDQWELNVIHGEVSTAVIMNWPHWNQFVSLLDIIQNNENPADLVHQILPLFIKKLSVTKGDKQLEWNSSQLEPLNLTHLPANLLQSIQSIILKNTHQLANIDLFAFEQLKDLKFNLFDPAILELFKMIFLFDLKDIHRDIFELSGILETQYILNMSPVERKVYQSFVPSKESTIETPEPQNLSAAEQLAKDYGV